MVYETYRYIFIGGAVLAIAMLIVTILLFFLLHIPGVFGDLSGRNQRKAIEQIRSQNAKTGNTMSLSTKLTVARKKQTRKMTNTVRLPNQPASVPPAVAVTPPPPEPETTVLDCPEPAAAPVDLPQESGMTTVLAKKSADGSVEIAFEITFIHTDEVIE